MSRGVSAYDEARLQGRLWDPRTMPNLAMYLSAQSVSGFGEGRLIAGWRDESSFGNHLTSLAGDGPARQTINGNPVQRFTSDVLANDALDGFTKTGNIGPRTWVMIWRGNTNVSAEVINACDPTKAAPQNAFRLATISSTGNKQVTFYNNANTLLGARQYSPRDTLSIDTFRIDAASSQCEIFVNGAANFTIALTAGTASFTRLTMAGARGGGTSHTDLEVYGFAYVDRAISNREMALLEASLAWSVGLQDLLPRVSSTARPVGNTFAARPPLIGD